MARISTTKTEKRGPQATGLFIGTLVLTALALFITWEALRMPMPGSHGLLSAPGFLPMATGITILLLSLALMLPTLRQGGHRHVLQWLGDNYRDRENRRLFGLVLITALYVALLGRIPFVLATMTFHLLVFGYLKAGPPLKVVLLAALATLLVGYLLPILFDMPAP